MALRPSKLTVVCALALVAIGVLTGCGKSSNKPGETVREGLSTPLGGLRYTVFLTRQLNLANQEDKGYVPGRKEAPPGKGLYGVFIEACNQSGSKGAIAASRFYIQDSQGNRFAPQGLAHNNPYAYQGGPVPPQNCMPRSGSLAALGPTSGALLLFELPLADTENRPLTLHIQGPFNAGQGKPDQTSVILDI
ncbi:MAG TPA: hypothetical protein VH300_18705 [Thermoleophilaceae bacterium]|nr:hypothetical protein [Thermoleophilaceae bacterium]